MKGWSLRWASYSNGGYQERVSLTADDEVGEDLKVDEWYVDHSSIDGKSMHTDVPNCCSNHCENGSAKDPSPRCYIFSSGRTEFPYTRRSPSWRISRHTMRLPVRWLCLCSTGYWSVYLRTNSTCFISKVGKSFWPVLWYFLDCPTSLRPSSNIDWTRIPSERRWSIISRWVIVRDMADLQWVVFFFFFFCGLSWHLSTALWVSSPFDRSSTHIRLAHLTGYNMQWASTIKEVELSHFFKEWPAMWKRFWDIWVVSWIIIVGVAIMASDIVPYGYRITNFTCILPIMTQACCHFLYPIVLNPWCEFAFLVCGRGLIIVLLFQF